MAKILKGTSGRTRLLFSGELTLPGNSEYSVLLDTTRKLPDEYQTAPAKSATVPTVGAERGQGLGRQFAVLASSVTQTSSIVVYYLNGNGAWSIDSSKTTTLTAGAADAYVVVDPSAAGSSDCLVMVLAGATAPAHIYASLTEITKP
jgi:hypothetical protein